MAITVRKGYESQFDINKMLPGEFAVTTDTHKVYVCMAAGISKELASVEELRNILDASDEAFEAFQELINAMEDGAVVTGLLNDVSNLKSGNYTISFSEAEERSNIESTDTLKVILGKIKKFFSSLSDVALTGKSIDVTYDNSNSGLEAEDVQGAIDEVDAKLFSSSDNNDFNSLTKSGIYRINSNINAPFNPGYETWFCVTVFNIGEGYITQSATSISNGNIYSRNCFGGIWDEWKKPIEQINELNTKKDNAPSTFTEMWEIGHSLYGGGLYIPLITNCKNISITSVQVFLPSGWTDVRYSSYRQPMGKTIIVCDNPGDDTLGKSYLVRLTGSVS